MTVSNVIGVKEKEVFACAGSRGRASKHSQKGDPPIVTSGQSRTTSKDQPALCQLSYVSTAGPFTRARTAGLEPSSPACGALPIKLRAKCEVRIARQDSDLHPPLSSS